MKLVDRLNNSAIQSFTLNNIDDGSLITCTLRYLSTQRAWSLDVASGDFVANGLIVTVSPNILSQWSNVINFGIGFATTDEFEILLLDDFKSQRSQMFLLSSDDVADVEATINA